MPIYEYQCQSCGHELEALQKVGDAPLTECPECHRDGLQKKISAAGFRLKGSGWYETDFKKGSEKKRNLADGDKKSAKNETSGSQDKSSKGQTGKSAAKAASST